MTSGLVGIRVKLRLYAPGEEFSAAASGVIVACVPKPAPQEFHNGYRIRLDTPLSVEETEVGEVYSVPTGSYPYEPGKEKMLDVLKEPVYVTVSWRLPDGTAYTYGEKGTFAELTLLQS